MFHEQWFPPESQKLLGRLVEETAGVDGTVVEVGSWEGCSTVALANASHPAVVHAVDTWEGSPGEVSADLAAERDVFNEWRSNIGKHTKGNVVAFRMGWRRYFAEFAGPIRLLFIDAEHTYREVRDNILAAYPHVVPGGIMCGDDVNHPPVALAVWDTLGNVTVEATCWWWRKP